METQTAFVGTDRAVELNAVAQVGLNFAFVVHPRYAEGSFNGKFGWWNKLRLMWALKVAHKADRVLGLIFGVTPEFHGKGIEAGIIREFEKAVPKLPYKSLELAWIGDFNPVMMRMVESYVCATKHKMHTTYRYLFDRTKEFHRCPRMGVKRRE